MKILQAKIDKYEKSLQRQLRDKRRRVTEAEAEAMENGDWGADLEGVDAATLAKEQDFGEDFLGLKSTLKKGRRGLKDIDEERNSGMDYFKVADEVYDLSQDVGDITGDGFNNILKTTDAPLSQDQLAVGR